MVYLAHMNRGRVDSSGYTIVEALIFLAVSAALFVSATLLISGRQNKVQFSNAVRDFESQLIDIANDVATGYYESKSDLTCSVAGGVPVLSTGGADTKGKNSSCIFVGKALKFGQTESYETYTMYGLRLDGTGEEVKSLSETKAKIDSGNNFKSIVTLGAGSTVKCVDIGAGCAVNSNNAAIGFVSQLRGGAPVDNTKSGSGINAVLYRFESVSLTGPIDNDISANNPQIVAGPIKICLLSGATNQVAIITLNAGSGLSITSEIRSGSSCV